MNDRDRGLVWWQRVKVSLFLQDGIQNMDGTIVQPKAAALPFGVGPPGQDQRFDPSGKLVKTLHVSLPQQESVTPAEAPHIGLSSNIYAKDRKPTAAPATAAAASSAKIAAQPAMGAQPSPNKVTGTTASAELNLLANLIGGGAATEKVKDANFKINLFPETLVG